MNNRWITILNNPKRGKVIMGAETSSIELTYKEEATAQLQHIDRQLLGRGYSVGSASSIPFEVTGNLNARVQHAIKTEQERFPDNPEVFTDEFVVGLTLGVWVAMHETAIAEGERS